MRFVLFAWVLCIVAFSIAPIPFKDLFHTRGHWHYVGHFAVFFSSAILFCWRSRGAARKGLACLGLFILALVVEALEHLIYRNGFEWQDVAVDTAAIVAGLLVIAIAESLDSRPRAQSDP